MAAKRQQTAFETDNENDSRSRSKSLKKRLIKSKESPKQKGMKINQVLGENYQERHMSIRKPEKYKFEGINADLEHIVEHSPPP